MVPCGKVCRLRASPCLWQGLEAEGRKSEALGDATPCGEVWRLRAGRVRHLVMLHLVARSGG
eukprot:2638818-Amphidinium_carterae.1